MTPATKMLLSLALLAFLISPVLSLSCYTCNSVSTNEACNQNNEECSPLLDTCMTAVVILGSDKVISKQCASRATCDGAASSASVDSNGDGNVVNCCNSFNLCNFSGAESVHIHTAVLLLAAGVLFLLAC